MPAHGQFWKVSWHPPPHAPDGTCSAQMALTGHLHVTSADTIIQIDRFLRTRGPYPAWAGGLWLCRTLVLSGFHAVVVPSGFRTRVQPHRWITTWW